VIVGFVLADDIEVSSGFWYDEVQSVSIPGCCEFCDMLASKPRRAIFIGRYVRVVDACLFVKTSYHDERAIR
jgi:hypothetical protein